MTTLWLREIGRDVRWEAMYATDGEDRTCLPCSRCSRWLFALSPRFGPGEPTWRPRACVYMRILGVLYVGDRRPCGSERHTHSKKSRENVYRHLSCSIVAGHLGLFTANAACKVDHISDVCTRVGGISHPLLLIRFFRVNVPALSPR